MDKKAALLALLSVWGVGTCPPDLALAQDAVELADEDAGEDRLVNRAWIRVDDTGLPGTMHIFLSDGTLVSDSCWETYRFSSWQMASPGTISWDEDGVTITAEVASVTAEQLVLRLNLGNEVDEQHFTPATIPYVCPDFPRGLD